MRSEQEFQSVFWSMVHDAQQAFMQQAGDYPDILLLSESDRCEVEALFRIWCTHSFETDFPRPRKEYCGMTIFFTREINKGQALCAKTAATETLQGAARDSDKTNPPHSPNTQ